METTTLRKTRIFWPWEDEIEENWLSEMARQGWHLSAVKPFGSYRFIKGQPAEVTYRMDFQSGTIKNKSDYLQLFSDAGWEYVGEMTGWHYFRIPTRAGQSPEIFTDRNSKLEKFKRLQAYMATTTGAWVPLFVAVQNNTETVFGKIIVGIYALYPFFAIYILLRLNKRMKQLKNEL